MVRCILSKFYIKPQLYNFWIKAHNCCILSKFYIKPQHSHETYCAYHSCILSKFYIKPQLFYADLSKVRRCILSKFYIKPQQRPPSVAISAVVSYRNSTSNHNPDVVVEPSDLLYLIEILHQTTTVQIRDEKGQGCILSKFYIKPQLRHPTLLLLGVVSYRNSTSNHNQFVK